MRKVLLYLIFIFTLILIFSKNTSAQPDLVGYWRFNDCTAQDSSVYGNNGIMYGTTCLDGKIGKALSFDGDNDYVKIPYNESFDITDAITIETWVNIGNNSRYIVNKLGSYLLQFTDTGSLQGGIWVAGSWKYLVGITTTLNEWHHVAFTYDKSLPSNQAKLYVDGNLDAYATNTSTIDSTTNDIYIGNRYDLLRDFNGTIDEVRIYNRALTAEEIYSHYTETTYNLYGQLKDYFNKPVQASITLFNQGTAISNATGQTDTNGNYTLSTYSNTYDIFYNLSNFFIQNFWIKLMSFNLNEDKRDVINYITQYPSENKLSFTVDITRNQTVQLYSPERPKRVLMNGTNITEVSSILELRDDTWFYDSNEKKLYIIINGRIIYSDEFLYGVCSHPWSLNERDFQEMQKLGVKYIRMDFSWQGFQSARGAPFNFTNYDRFTNWSRIYGVKIIPILMRVPSWFGTGGDINIPNITAFDDFVSQFGDFVYAVVDHYKDNITYFEIWNEPNWYKFWNDSDATYKNGEFVRGTGISKYVTLLKEAYTRAKAANPNCKIISGGIGNDDYYLEEMYNYGVKGYFDIFGSHPYFGSSPTKNYDVDYINPQGDIWDFPKIQYMRNVMVANGDGAKTILITELGIDDENGPEGPTNEEIQADRLTRIFEKTLQEFPYVEGIMWYKLRDTSTGNYGLFKSDYTTRLMYYAYKQLISNVITTNPAYTVYQSGSNYYVNDSSGSVIYQSTNAGDVINYAISNSSDGDRIFLQSGSYSMTSQINDYGKNFITFEGKGKDTEIIVSGAINGFYIKDQKDWIFRNFKIKGTKVAKGVAGFENGHFYLINCSDITIENVWSQTANGYSVKPIEFNGGTYNTNIKIINNFLDDPGHNCLSSAGLNNSLFKNNTCIKNDYGLDMELIWIGAKNVSGIMVGSFNNEILNNQLIGGSIALNLDSYDTHNLAYVSNNTFSNNSITGNMSTYPIIYIHGWNNIISKNNITDENITRTSWIVTLEYDPSSDHTLVNKGNIIKENTIYHKTAVAIGAWNRFVNETSIVNNRIRGTPSGNSIYINNATSDYINCTGNVVRRTIYIAGNAHGIVSNNTENTPD